MGEKLKKTPLFKNGESKRYMEPARDAVSCFTTNDPDEFAERLATVEPHHVAVQPLGVRFAAHGKMIALPRLSLFTLQMDNTRVFQSESIHACGINISLAEPLRFHRGLQSRVCLNETAFVRRPGDSFDIRTPQTGRLLVAHLSPLLLTSIEEKFPPPHRLSDTFSLVSPEGAIFSRFLRFMWRELEHDTALLRSPLITHEFENSLAAMFYAACHSGHQESQALSTAKRPRYLARAEEYIRANLAEPLSVLDIAATAEVSPRKLAKAFRKHRGVSTSTFVKMLRLEAARRDLLAAVPGNTTVTDVALEYGFVHLGRFSVDYRRTFGETPSETLRRSLTL
jgi:AraC-like DNA-binding protein